MGSKMNTAVTVANTGYILLLGCIVCVLGAPMEIFFGENNVIKAYSLDTHATRTVKSSYDGSAVLGIAYESKNGKLYYSLKELILRMDLDGSNEAIVFSSFSYGWMNGLEADSVTGNLYVATELGYVLTCTTVSGRFTCTEILNAGTFLYDITLDPSRGLLFVSGTTSGAIYRAQMDSSGFATLFAALGEPTGITFRDSLTWADRLQNKILMGSWDGEGPIDTVQLQSGARPSGMTAFDTVFPLFWGNQGSRTLQSVSPLGLQLETLYAGAAAIGPLTTVEPLGINEAGTRNESNPCESQGCSHLCVLKGAQSVRCLCPPGLRLGEDDRVCVGSSPVKS